MRHLNAFEDPRWAAGAPAPSDQSRLCFECARNGHTCCQQHDIYVTWGDCRRIFAQVRRDDFYEYRGCSHSDYAEQTDDPLWQYYVFRADGTRRVLKRTPDGDCIFLTAAGCSLPLNVRPLVCRLFPHLYSAGGIAGDWDPECPAARSCAAAAIETGIAGVAPGEAMQWHQRLYREIRWEGLGDENRTDV